MSASDVVVSLIKSVRVPGTTFLAVHNFVEALDKDPVFIVSELCRHSSGKEVTSLLNDAMKLKAPDIALIFTVLEKILLAITADLPAMESFALEMAELLMTKHLRTFYYMCKTTNKSNQIKAALKLLISGTTRFINIVSVE